MRPSCTRPWSLVLFTPAFAQTAGAAGGGFDSLINLAPFAAILVIMYFLVMRPQQRRAKEHRELVANVRRGDTVVTSGGIIGRVSKTIDASEVEVEIAPNVRVRVLRQMITEVRNKGEPVKDTPVKA